MNAEYICKNLHTTSYPNLKTEARKNEQTGEFLGYLLCEQCGADLNINGTYLKF